MSSFSSRRSVAISAESPKDPAAPHETSLCLPICVNGDLAGCGRFKNSSAAVIGVVHRKNVSATSGRLYPRAGKVSNSPADTPDSRPDSSAKANWRTAAGLCKASLTKHLNRRVRCCQTKFAHFMVRGFPDPLQRRAQKGLSSCGIPGTAAVLFCLQMTPAPFLVPIQTGGGVWSIGKTFLSVVEPGCVGGACRNRENGWFS